MIFIHMGEGLQEFQDGSSSSSTPSAMLSMGEDFMDKEKNPMEYDDHGCHKMLMILLPC